MKSKVNLEKLKKKVVIPLKGKIRRFYYCNFNKTYVIEQIMNRKGHCSQCGKCCYFLFKCPFLGFKNGKSYCTIYDKKRPKQCVAFPIDEKDLADVDFTCTHSFPKK